MFLPRPLHSVEKKQSFQGQLRAPWMLHGAGVARCPSDGPSRSKPRGWRVCLDPLRLLSCFWNESVWRRMLPGSHRVDVHLFRAWCTHQTWTCPENTVSPSRRLLMCEVSSVSMESEAGGGRCSAEPALGSSSAGGQGWGWAWTRHSPSPRRPATPCSRPPHAFPPEGAGSRRGRLGCRPLRCYCPPRSIVC